MAQLPQKGQQNWDEPLNELLLTEHNPDGTHNIAGSGLILSYTGSVISFAGSTAPTGWLICDGAEISRTEYANLYTVIADLYGAGDGSTTFNVPDLRGEFMRGLDNGRGVDANRTLGSAQGDDFKSHAHTGSTSTDGNHAHSGVIPHTHSGWLYRGVGDIQYDSRGGFFENRYPAQAVTVDAAGNHAHSLSIAATGGAETRPRNVAMNYIIKF